MPIAQVKTIIKETVINSITKFANQKSKKKVDFQILDSLIPRERKIRSIVGGLETSLGKTLWEPLAKNLAKTNGFTVVNENLMAPTQMPDTLGNVLNSIIQSREKRNTNYDSETGHQAIKSICREFITTPITTFSKPPQGRGVDIWLQKNDIDYFFDTKTVKPNIEKFKNLLSQLHYWYAYYYSKKPSGQAFARIVFPFNPYIGDDFWNKSKGGGKPLERLNEAWVENEFWDFVSGEENTFSLIKECFTEIHSSGILQKELNQIFDK